MHNSNGFAKRREPCTQIFRPRLQSLPVLFSPHNVNSDLYIRRTSHDFDCLLHIRSNQENIKMATVSSSAMIAPGLNPPVTPRLTKAKMQVPATPPSTRRSGRAKKDTGKSRLPVSRSRLCAVETP